MPLANDGDVIRGLGYVALYFAYLEEAIDDLLESLERCGVALPQNMMRRSTSQKIAFCRDSIQPHVASSQEMASLDGALQYAADRFEERNDVIHGRIYAQFEGPDMRRSGRRGVPDRPITSEELYSLANNAYDVMVAIMQGHMFSVFRGFKRCGPQV